MRSDGRGLEKTKSEESYFVYSGGEEAIRVVGVMMSPRVTRCIMTGLYRTG